MAVKRFSVFHGISRFFAKASEDALFGLTQHAIIPLEISKECKEQMKKIMRRVKCRKGFECCKSGLTKLCPVNIIGSTKLIECLADDPRDCGLRVCLGRGTFCQCPLRRYIAENFNM